MIVVSLMDKEGGPSPTTTTGPPEPTTTSGPPTTTTTGLPPPTTTTVPPTTTTAGPQPTTTTPGPEPTTTTAPPTTTTPGPPPCTQPQPDCYCAMVLGAGGDFVGPMGLWDRGWLYFASTGPCSFHEHWNNSVTLFWDAPLGFWILQIYLVPNCWLRLSGPSTPATAAGDYVYYQCEDSGCNDGGSCAASAGATASVWECDSLSFPTDCDDCPDDLSASWSSCDSASGMMHWTKSFFPACVWERHYFEGPPQIPPAPNFSDIVEGACCSLECMGDSCWTINISGEAWEDPGDPENYGDAFSCTYVRLAADVSPLDCPAGVYVRCTGSSACCPGILVVG